MRLPPGAVALWVLPTVSPHRGVELSLRTEEPRLLTAASFNWELLVLPWVLLVVSPSQGVELSLLSAASLGWELFGLGEWGVSSWASPQLAVWYVS